MADGKLLEGWEGYSAERVEWPQEPRRTLAVHLKAMGREMHCEQYGAPCHQVQETTTRRVRDLPLFEPRWPGQIPPPLATPNSPRQDRSDYDDSGVMAMRAAASLRR